MRPVIALDPRLFGRGPTYSIRNLRETVASDSAWSDLKLFATTFLGGFMFVAVYLA